MAGTIICPTCGQADQVEKVSILYMHGIEAKWHARKGASPGDQAGTSVRSSLADEMPADELQRLTRRLAPPATKKEAFTRPIHPDQVVLAFSLVAPVFLYGVYTSQPGVLPLMLLVLGSFYAFYFWKRRQMVAKFQATQQIQRTAGERARRGVQRWMNLYYCARDDGVFEPGGAALTPADQLAGYLFKD